MNKKSFSFFSKKKILITGHTGFVGTWMCMFLQSCDADIFGLSLEAEEKSLYREVEKSLKIKSYICDLREGEKVKKIISDIKPEIVIHLAAFGFVKECMKDPVRTFSSNVMGTVNLLEACTKVPAIKSILVVSSDKVYKNVASEKNKFFSETDSLGGIDIYSCSKTCEDLVMQSYFASYFQEENVTCNIARPGNILGGGDYIQSRLIPSLLRGFSTNTPVEIRNRDAIRPWQNILDAIDAYLTIILKTWNHVNEIGIYNIGPCPNGQLTVGQISDYLQNKFDSNSRYKQIKRDKGLKEAEYLGVDISKMGKKLNWVPRKTIEETLDEIYYFWENRNNDVFEICMKFICDYINELDKGGFV